jgi:hypothetical protein
MLSYVCAPLSVSHVKPVGDLVYNGGLFLTPSTLRIFRLRGIVLRLYTKYPSRMEYTSQGMSYQSFMDRYRGLGISKLLTLKTNNPYLIAIYSILPSREQMS